MRTQWLSLLLLLVCVSAQPQTSAPSKSSQKNPPVSPSQNSSQVTNQVTIGALAKVLPPPAEHKFPNNQTFNYTVEWRLFTAGTASLNMQSAGREQRVVASADAAGVVALLYHVHDTLEAFFDPKTFCSLNISKHTEEGRRRLESNIVFDQGRGKSLLTEKNLKDGKIKTAENATPGCVSDVISSVYYIASLPLANGSTYFFPLNDGGKTAEVKVSTDAREEIKVPAGTYKTVRVQISSETGKLKDRGQIWIWFSDDAARTPVQMKARMFWGTLNFRLLRASSR